MDELKRLIESVLHTHMERLQTARVGKVTYPGTGNAKVRVRFIDRQVVYVSVNVYVIEMVRNSDERLKEYVDNVICYFLDDVTHRKLSTLFLRTGSTGVNFNNGSSIVMDIVTPLDERGVLEEIRSRIMADIASGTMFDKSVKHERNMAMKDFVKAVRNATRSNLNRDDLVQLIDEEVIRNVSDQ